MFTADSGSPPWCWEGARALSPRGRRYQPATIDAEMALRHAEQKHRRAGGRTQGPPPFGEEDREHFRSTLEPLLSEGPDTGTGLPLNTPPYIPIPPQRQVRKNPTPSRHITKPPPRWRGRDGVAQETAKDRADPGGDAPGQAKMLM